jgi:monoamine oxidase
VSVTEPAREADVVIVGAGLAGLAAARSLVAAGVEPLVLEARARVGGRVMTEPVGDGKAVDLGGQCVGPTHRRIVELAAELGVATFPTYDRGSRVLELDGRVRSYRGLIPRVSPAVLVDVGLARWRLDRMARRVRHDAPWEAPGSGELDGETLGSWLERTTRTRRGRQLLDAAMSAIWAAEPQDVSLLQALAYIGTAGSFDALAATRGGFQQDRFCGGSAALAERIAAAVGERVLLSTPVRAISWGGGGVRVDAAGTCVQAHRVIIAVPPRLAAQIDYVPALPPSRVRALDALPMGKVVKFGCVYDRPFWRERGLNGQALSARGPVTATIDLSPPDARPGVIAGFVPGAAVREFARQSPAERRRMVLSSLTRFFGSEAERPELFFEKDWTADEWTRGCYFGLARPGALSGPLRTLAERVGPLHWAGAETAFESYGGMNGAILSGERAAREVLQLLGSGDRHPARGGFAGPRIGTS